MYAQPSGLMPTWHLKYTVTLQSPPTHAHKHVSNIIINAVLNNPLESVNTFAPKGRVHQRFHCYNRELRLR